MICIGESDYFRDNNPDEDTYHSNDSNSKKFLLVNSSFLEEKNQIRYNNKPSLISTTKNSLKMVSNNGKYYLRKSFFLFFL